MSSGIQVSHQVIGLVLSVLEARGHDRADILAQVGLVGVDINDRDGWVSLEVEEALWRLGSELTGDAAFGLSAAHDTTLGGFPVIEYMMRACTNIRETVDGVVRYNRLTHESAVLELVEHGGLAWISHQFADPNREPIREAAEFTFGYMVRTLRGLSGQPDFRPFEVWFHFEAPTEPERYVEMFGERVLFDKGERRLVFERSFLDTPVQTADPQLAQILRQHAELMLTSLPETSSTWLGRFRDALAAELAGGDPTVQNLADILHVSVRTLQRQLSADDTSFKAELEGMREDLARRYLREPSMSVAEVAFLLGYSEPSAFHRAFRRWTGATPGAFRRA